MNVAEARLAVVGLGYVGLPVAVEFGKLRPVIGFDINPRRVEELVAGHDRTLEVSDEELTGGNLTFSSHETCLDDADVFIGLSGNIDGLVHLSDISWDIPCLLYTSPSPRD